MQLSLNKLIGTNFLQVKVLQVGLGVQRHTFEPSGLIMDTEELLGLLTENPKRLSIFQVPAILVMASSTRLRPAILITAALHIGNYGWHSEPK